MLGIADLLTVAVINKGLEHLAANPYHIEFVLGAFAAEPLRSMVGTEHLKQCVDFIKNNRIHVAPYYQVDIKRRPNVAVVASGREDQQFLGDYGTQGLAKPEFSLPPRVYAQFDAIGLTNTSLVVPSGLGLANKVWPGQFITNGEVTTRVNGYITNTSGNDTLLLLDAIPAAARLTGWQVLSSPRTKGIVCGASQDLVTIQCILTTTGDSSVHRLLAIIIRYCLKHGRPTFEAYGLQVPVIAYTPMIQTDEGELEFQSTLTIEARYTDLWIDHEYDLPDAASKIDIDIVAVPQTSTNGEENVNLDDE